MGMIKQFARVSSPIMLIALLALLITACNARPQPSVSSTLVPTFAPVSASANYWDLGIALKYPSNWITPIYAAGQMMLVPTPEDATRQPPTAPIVELQFATLEQLHLDKTATLMQIAELVSGQTRTTKQFTSSSSTFAGLDAGAVLISDVTNNLAEEAIAFRAPDGRIGWLIALAPLDIWANFAPTFDTIRTTATLLRPHDYPAPTVSVPTTFPLGGLTFLLPPDWKATSLSGGVTIYHSTSDFAYRDGSGFANGSQLVVRALPLTEGVSIADALLDVIGSGDKPSAITIGTATGAQVIRTDASTGQQIHFIAFASQDGTILNVLRWTTPSALTDAAAPLLDSILKSVTLGAITATLQPAGIVSPTPNPVFFKDIPQNNTPDGAPIFGDPKAPVRVVEFLDFSCPHCLEYFPTMHSFLDTYVRTGKARVEWRYVTFVGHEYSAVAATAALCAGEQNEQGAMHDTLFYIQGSQGAKMFVTENLVKAATALGLDKAKFADCMTKGKADVLAATDKLVTLYNIQHTPTLLIARNDDTPTPIVGADGKAIQIPSLAELEAAVEKMAAK